MIRSKWDTLYRTRAINTCFFVFINLFRQFCICSSKQRKESLKIYIHKSEKREERTISRQKKRQRLKSATGVSNRISEERHEEQDDVNEISSRIFPRRSFLTTSFQRQRWIANITFIRVNVVQRVERERFSRSSMQMRARCRGVRSLNASGSDRNQDQVQFRWLFIRFHGRWDTSNQRWPNMAGRGGGGEGVGKWATAATTLRNCRCLRKQRNPSRSLENA